MDPKVLDSFFSTPPSFLEYINARAPIERDLRAQLSDVFQTDQIDKAQLLVREGMVAHRIYFIQKGSARTYYLQDGKDVTSWFYREGQLVTSWSSFYKRVPSFENVELTEDSVVVSLSFDELQTFYREHPKMQEFGRLMVEEQLIFLDYFYRGFMFMSAKEKYELLLSIFPDVTQRVNLGHIASFLGISQETLSRIRKRG
ncbi:MAG: Crp/Fnr family transcriptional regulator [Bacteroidota bacterium]